MDKTRLSCLPILCLRIILTPQTPSCGSVVFFSGNGYLLKISSVSVNIIAVTLDLSKPSSKFQRVTEALLCLKWRTMTLVFYQQWNGHQSIDRLLKIHRSDLLLQWGRNMSTVICSYSNSNIDLTIPWSDLTTSWNDLSCNDPTKEPWQTRCSRKRLNIPTVLMCSPKGLSDKQAQ